MKRTRFFAILLTASLLLGFGAAGGSVLMQNLFNNPRAEAVDNDIAGLLEGGFDIQGTDINSILSGIIGTTAAVQDDSLSTITTIIQALMGGTAEGETTLDAIKEKLGDLGGTVTENELMQALFQTLLGFDLTNFDMSMLTSNEFISQLMENLGGVNVGGATPVVTTTAPAATTPGTVLTTAQPVVTTTLPPVSNSITAGTNTSQTPVVTMPSTTPTMPVISSYPDSSTQYADGVGVIVDNSLNIQQYPGTDVNNIPTTPEIPSDTAEQPANKISGKMIVGILVLVLSGISVVAVALVMKKNK